MKHLSIEQFSKDVSTHLITVNLDQGVFRDITIKKPDSSDFHYNITTRRGYLIITGDMGSYVFARLKDMFNFFRCIEGYEINLGYWGEKVEAGEVEKYSPEAAREALNQEFENWKEGTDSDEAFIREEKENLDFIDTDDYFEFIQAVRDWVPNKNGVELNDFWEYDLKEYTYHYIWCCYAIVHAIKLYDEYKAQEQSHD